MIPTSALFPGPYPATFISSDQASATASFADNILIAGRIWEWLRDSLNTYLLL